MRDWLVEGRMAYQAYCTESNTPECDPPQDCPGHEAERAIKKRAQAETAAQAVEMVMDWAKAHANFPAWIGEPTVTDVSPQPEQLLRAMDPTTAPRLPGFEQ